MIEHDEEVSYFRVASLVFGQPLLIGLQQAEIVGNFLRARMERTTPPPLPQPEASRFIGAPQRDPETGASKGYRLAGNVGVVSVLGELVNRGAWMGSYSGLTSYEGFLQQLRAAAADPEVESIVLDINSPGGEAAGMFDTARQIRPIANGKPVIAVANAHALSAAYGLASAADRIVVNEGGSVGSVGVVIVHMDQSDKLAKAGVKATVIKTGPRKMLGDPFGPLSDDAAAALRSKADEIMSGFTKLVSDFRPHLTDAALRDFEGDTFLGQRAVDAGLADAVGSFESVVASLATSSRAPVRFPGLTPRSSLMETPVPGAQAPTPVPAATGITQAQLDAAVAKAAADASAKSSADLAAAMTAERARMAGLDELLAEAGAGASEIVAKAKADGSSVDATARSIFKAKAHLPAAALAGLQADEATARGATPATAGAPGTSARVPQTRDGWKAEYEASTALQAEFGSSAAYVAFKDNEAKGNVRILQGKTAA